MILVEKSQLHPITDGAEKEGELILSKINLFMRFFIIIFMKLYFFIHILFILAWDVELGMDIYTVFQLEVCQKANQLILTWYVSC